MLKVASALLHKIEGHVARVNDVVLLSKEEGVWTASDDRSVRLYLKRDNGQFWPSIHKIMPVAPTCLYYSEETSRLFVGLLNGHVYEYHVADDYNSMSDPEARRWTIHAGPISGLGIALNAELVFSCSKDKSVVWHCSETGIKRGAFHCDSSCTAMVIDLPFVFIGDHGGNVVVLRLSGDSAQMVSKLSAHTGPVSSLAWNRMKEILYSGSHDNLVIMWDIGGKRGEAYELKLETPGWKTSDNCEVCDAPFFWNLTAMWQRKVVGQRQHHCRTCGKAVCGACCSNWTVFPRMGYELPVRICSVCHQKMEENPQQFDLTPLAVSHDIRSGVTAMHLQETLGKLVTASQNRMFR
ncbi:FYVE zinc finger [Ancylostoma ceylanicum]|uniref:FYVE zinc finger n=1 Tax=Ancylostoma ceylanicum TaxID=53326 RepID=A0A0D6LRT0_9BILA|nr:FYVE zinc finger [Ancylostoma ceylanicum]